MASLTLTLCIKSYVSHREAVTLPHLMNRYFSRRNRRDDLPLEKPKRRAALFGEISRFVAGLRWTGFRIETGVIRRVPATL
jgi:hypothetical protein